MKPKLYLIGAFLLLISSHLAIAQASWVVTGVVTDAETGEPLMGASVVQSDRRSGTNTDEDGKFRLTSIVPSDTLEIRYMGYETQKVPFSTGNLHLVVKLKETTTTLEAIEIIEAPRRVDHSYTMSSVRSADISGVSSSGKSRKKERSASAEYGYYAPAAFIPATDARAGLLTAGELNDFSKWELWQDIDTTVLAQFRKVWGMRPMDRYVVQVQTEGGFPVVDAAVTLRKGKVLWSARTDNTGKAELWHEPFSLNATPAGKLKIQVEHAGVTAELGQAVPFQEGLNLVTLKVNCKTPAAVDIAFVVDATSSMGDEIAYLKEELRDIIQKAKATLPDKELRLGSVFYRDQGDEYLTRNTPFTKATERVDKFIREQQAGGGGDYPEAVQEGLGEALKKLEWSDNATARILFLILDAPPHGDKVKEMQELAALAAEKGVRIVPLVASGIDKSAEYLMRSLALLSNGTYVFLTDDSGIGGSHIKPTTDKWVVESLNEILIRIIFQYTRTIDCQQEMAVVKPETLMVLPPDSSSGSSAEGPIHSHEQGFTNDKDWQKAGKDANISWKYWPNPTRGPLDLEVKGEKKGMIYLSDLSGKLLERRDIPAGGNLHLELGRYPAGTYYLKCEYDDDHWLSGKVVLLK